jgi:hypothetical protein
MTWRFTVNLLKKMERTATEKVPRPREKGEKLTFYRDRFGRIHDSVNQGVVQKCLNAPGWASTAGAARS